MPINVGGYTVDEESARQQRYDGVIQDGLIFQLDSDIFIKNQSSNAWYDLSNNSTHATVYNGLSYDSANRGMSFDGVNDFCSFGTTLGNALPSISVSVWFNPSTLTQTNTQRYVVIGAEDASSSGDESVFNMFLTYIQNDTNYPSSFNGQHIVFGVRSATQSLRTRPIITGFNSNWAEYIYGCAFSQNNVNLSVGTWINVVGVYDGSETTIYVNGVLDGSSTSQPDSTDRSVSGVLNTSAISRRVGYTSLNGLPFSGLVSQALIYDRVLTATEIQENYNIIKTRYGL